MQDASKLVERLENGEEVSVAEIIDRANELECIFDDRGYVYISNNGWLVSSLEADGEARELMLLRDLLDHLDGVSMGTVFIAGEPRSETDIAIGELGGRYAPDGYLFAVDKPGSEWSRPSGSGFLK